MALTFKNQTASTRKPFLKRWAHVRSSRNLDWIDAVPSTREVPTGTKNGTNLSFTLSATGSQIFILLRGLTLKYGVGYTLSGTALTMLEGYAPESTDAFEAVIVP